MWRILFWLRSRRYISSGSRRRLCERGACDLGRSTSIRNQYGFKRSVRRHLWFQSRGRTIPVEAHVRPDFRLNQRPPFDNSYDGKLSPGLKALGEMPFAAWVQILGAIAVIELTVGKQDYENKVRADYE